jgi:hypothetical protein
MPDPAKKAKRYAARVAAIKARQEKKAKKKGARYEKAGERKETQAVKHMSKSVSTKNPVRKTMQAEKGHAAKASAARLKSAGAKAKSTGRTPPEEEGPGHHGSIRTQEPDVARQVLLRKQAITQGGKKSLRQGPMV